MKRHVPTFKEPTSVEEAELELTRIEAELAAFDVTKETYAKLRAEGLLRDTHYETWETRRYFAKMRWNENRARMTRWRNGLIRIQERRMLYRPGDISSSPLAEQLHQERIKNASLREDVKNQAAKHEKAKKAYARITEDLQNKLNAVRASKSATVHELPASGQSRKDYAKNVERAERGFEYVLALTEKRGYVLPPLLKAFLVRLQNRTRTYVTNEQFEAEDAPGLTAFLEKIIEEGLYGYPKG